MDDVSTRTRTGPSVCERRPIRAGPAIESRTLTVCGGWNRSPLLASGNWDRWEIAGENRLSCVHLVTPASPSCHCRDQGRSRP